ncbi:MAG: Gfo/Idh/MocA family oxidoreductase, partial [Victivallales bacterium]|nr:Gfo/Idh/MocA family oxidoreductase [Victivallales bacterium]
MKTYCIVGTGGRSWMYTNALMGDFKEYGQLLAFCDLNQARMDYYNKKINEKFGHAPLPTYRHYDFDKMILEQKPDRVIVTSMDRTHHYYICRAMELGCDVITEKPMTMDAEKCQQIIDTKHKTGKNLTVCFNYRYAPRNTKVKELLAQGICGEIISVHFEWLLDTSHGADYFRRWHRDKRNSGGLLVHKATHHFDLVNWFLEQEPVKVNAFGRRGFYGPTREQRSERCLTCPYKKKCEFYVDLDTVEGGVQKRLYKDCEDVDGYFRDGCVFSDEIDIEDTVSVNVRYSGGTVLSYSLNAHCPYECMKIVFNGTKGRLEADTAMGKETIKYYNRKGEEFNYNHYNKKPMPGGHGGSDRLLQDYLFRGYDEDPLHQMADTRAGAMSIGIGIAANKSM